MKARIIILDDQEPYIRALERALRGEYEIVPARSLVEAESASFSGVQIALVDIRLREDKPGNREGLAFIGWLGENHPEVAAIAMSAIDEPGLDEAAMATGAVRFLPKPVRVSELKEILRELVK